MTEHEDSCQADNLFIVLKHLLYITVVITVKENIIILS